jgi:hypothetical protein
MRLFNTKLCHQFALKTPKAFEQEGRLEAVVSTYNRKQVALINEAVHLFK